MDGLLQTDNPLGQTHHAVPHWVLHSVNSLIVQGIVAYENTQI
jgi:hypothetical protein